MLLELRKQLINNSVFPTWDCAASFNNNNMLTENTKMIRKLNESNLAIAEALYIKTNVPAMNTDSNGFVRTITLFG